jgi:hypothetical protein
MLQCEEQRLFYNKVITATPTSRTAQHDIFAIFTSMQGLSATPGALEMEMMTLDAISLLTHSVSTVNCIIKAAPSSTVKISSHLKSGQNTRKNAHLSSWENKKMIELFHKKGANINARGRLGSPNTGGG